MTKYCKLWLESDRPDLSSERAPHETWQKPSNSNKHQVMRNRRGSTSNHTWLWLWQRLALSVGPNWVVSTWKRRQNPVSETSCFREKTGLWITSRIFIVMLNVYFHPPSNYVMWCRIKLTFSWNNLEISNFVLLAEVHVLQLKLHLLLSPHTSLRARHLSHPWYLSSLRV
jgi:hypothetical protein